MTKTETKDPQQDHLDTHKDLAYINEILKGLKVKQLDYVRTLVDNHISEKRARHTMNKPKSAVLKDAGYDVKSAPMEPHISSYDLQREDEDNYI